MMNTPNTYDSNKAEDTEANKISYLRQKLPVLANLFHIHGKIGEGTFSSVFLATLKSSQNQKFAIKHLVPTCHPERIERELQCLQKIGGTDFVVGLDLCLRSADCVIFVMPYMRHDKFSEYVHDMSVDETRCYMKALLTALQRVHKFNTIHRDVKPSNFLYDRTNRRFLLVDFGLAQQYTVPENNVDIQNQQSTTVPESGKRKRNAENKLSTKSTMRIGDASCTCFGKAKVCSICLCKPSQTAPRAGTPGFRAPEVLLKYTAQTPGIDIWASGVIMLCILSRTHPFFRAPDDCTALAEITSIFGSVKMQQCAKKLGKKITFSEHIPGIDIISLCQKLQKRNKNGQDYSYNCNIVEEKFDSTYPMAAYDLLMRLLEPDHTARINAADAITHPFFKT